ncbi:acyl transferase 1-like [Miscanthus floridulus]|uniref:acyl transferase 1-like n=1 Tax=Miscanthus floridulus TaxID=154761 RepID=UPI003459793F
MTTFKAHQSNPELVMPASPTPQGSKTLSDVDSQIPLWFYATVIEFFRPRDAVDGHETPVVDVAKAIREALAKALVYYYPIAGRLREVSKGKLAVECTGEGVVFVEAHADVRLDELGDALVPPYPCIEELVCDIGDAKDVVGRPLMFMQVTRFKCGGFAIGVSICHNMADAYGVIQFLKCVTDLARGQEHPAVLPVWDRELLMARNPPDLTSLPFFVSDEPSPPVQPMAMDKMAGDYFLFGPREIAALRSQVTEPATDFELITAAMWMCREEAIALALGCGRSADGSQQQRASSLLITMNVRGKAKLTPPLPRGFYGNGFVFVEAELRGTAASSLGGTVELVKKAKRGMTEEYVRSMVDLFSVGGAAPYAQGWTFVVSDITRIGEDQLDLGWAERVAGGVPIVGDDHATKLVSYQMRCKNADGDDCVVASMYLPEPAMDKFKEKILLILAS